MKALLLFTGRNAEHYAESSNATQMAYSLLEIGLDVDIQASNLADSAQFTADFASAVDRADVIIIIGGMGDDYVRNTRDIVCSGLGLSMVVHQPSLPKMVKLCEKQNRKMEESDLAYISAPVDSTVFEHRESVIPGFALVSGEQAVVMLPDNGEVYVDMFAAEVIPYLVQWLEIDVRHDMIFPFGITQRQAEFLLARLKDNRRPLISLFSRQEAASTIQVLEYNDGNSNIDDDMEDADFLIKGFLGGLYTVHPINEMPKKVVKVLRENEFTIAVGESLTEGLLARNLMAVKKHEEVLKGHADSLINVVKQEEMDIPKEITDRYPDASEEMAVAMAYGMMNKYGSDIGVSICGGLAADGRGGFDSTAFVTLITPQGVQSERIDLIGLSVSRDQAVGIYTIVALNMIYQFVTGLPESVRGLVGLASAQPEDIENTAQIIRYRAESRKQLLEERYDENQKIQDTAKTYMEIKPKPAVEVISEIYPGERVESSFEPNKMEMTLGFRGIANPEEYLKAERLATATIADFNAIDVAEEGGSRRPPDDSPQIVSEMPMSIEEFEKDQTIREAPIIDHHEEPLHFTIEEASSPPDQVVEEEQLSEIAPDIPSKEPEPVPITETVTVTIDESGQAVQIPPENAQENKGKEDPQMNQSKVSTQHFEPLTPKPEKKGGKTIKVVLLIVAVLLVAVGVFFGLRAYLNSSPQTIEAAMAQYKEVSTGALKMRAPSDYPEEYPDRFIPLYKINTDVEAVVEIPNTGLSVPVVKTGNNITYTETDFFQNASDDGTPFLDYRSDVDITNGNALVYGTSDGSTADFSVVTQYQDIRFAQDHPTLYFDTVMGGGDYAIFSTFIAGADNSRTDVYDFGQYIKAVDVDTFAEMVADCKERSITEFPVEVSYGDEVLMLCTDIDDFPDARFVVVARKFRENEKTEVNSGLMKLNASPLYPEQWYEMRGMEKPDSSRESITIDLSLTQEAPEEVAPVKTTSSAPTASTLPPSSVPVSSTPSSSTPTSSVPSSTTTSSEAPSSVAPSSTPATSSSPASSEGDGWIEVSAIDETKSQAATSSAAAVSSSTGGSGATGGGSGQGGTISVRANGGVVTGDAQEIVAGIVANEMGSNFSEEALKAQAVAAYSYILYENARGNTPTVYMSTPNSKVSNAVSSVIGQKVTYNGSVAYTTYYAMSAGTTNTSADVWGSSIPYLTSVSSPWDTSVASYQVNKTFSEAEVRSKIENEMGITVTGDPSTWFQVTSMTNSGYNENMTVCGQSKTASGKNITGRYLREAVFNLRSAAFDVTYSNGSFIFTTRGYGHGVGMSQWGAQGMAKEGYTYDQILNYYYPGTSIG